jgi:hypothetical protein
MMGSDTMKTEAVEIVSLFGGFSRRAELAAKMVLLIIDEEATAVKDSVSGIPGPQVYPDPSAGAGAADGLGATTNRQLQLVALARRANIPIVATYMGAWSAGSGEVTRVESDWVTFRSTKAMANAFSEPSFKYLVLNTLADRDYYFVTGFSSEACVAETSGVHYDQFTRKLLQQDIETARQSGDAMMLKHKTQVDEENWGLLQHGKRVYTSDTVVRPSPLPEYWKNYGGDNLRLCPKN